METDSSGRAIKETKFSYTVTGAIDEALSDLREPMPGGGYRWVQYVRPSGTPPTVKRELLDLTAEEFAAVSSDIEPITPRYDLYQTKSDWLNQKWTELIVG